MLGSTLVSAKQLLTGSQFNSNLSDQTVDQLQSRGSYALDADSKLDAGLGFTRVKNRAANFNDVNNDWGGVGAQGDHANVGTRTESLRASTAGSPAPTTRASSRATARTISAACGRARSRSSSATGA